MFTPAEQSLILGYLTRGDDETARVVARRIAREKGGTSEEADRLVSHYNAYLTEAEEPGHGSCPDNGKA